MSHESVKALERIVRLCEKSSNLTPRQVNIFEVALEGLGYVYRQRQEILAKWKEPHQVKMQAKRDRRMANWAAREEASYARI